MNRSSKKQVPVEQPPHIIVRRTKSGDRKYKVGKLLGKGGFARCYEIKDVRDFKRVYAAKIVQKSTLRPKTEAKLLSEIRIHRSLKHEGVVQLLTHFEDDYFVYIVLELCSNNTLMELLKARKRVSEAEVRYFMIQVLLTLQYIHGKGVIHRDLKLGNLLINDAMQIKLGDFGLATKLESDDERRRTVCGTPNYIAPEIINKESDGHTFPVDVWSVGCIIFTMLVGKPPFQSSQIKDTYSKIRTSSYQWPSFLHPSKDVQDLVKSMLHVNADARPSISDILRHPFFKSPIPR
tara:strand:- start:168 stop:1043 length:876 start_codon:yes stop_codon:yes gene_type:complete